MLFVTKSWTERGEFSPPGGGTRGQATATCAGTAGETAVLVEVADGLLDIDFLAEYGDPVLSALEVERIEE